MWTYNYSTSNELCHYGIKGQRWGVRRFETSSGHLTPAGKKRYDDGGVSKYKQKRQEKYEIRRKNMQKKQAEEDKIARKAYEKIEKNREELIELSKKYGSENNRLEKELKKSFDRILNDMPDKTNIKEAKKRTLKDKEVRNLEKQIEKNEKLYKKEFMKRVHEIAGDDANYKDPLWSAVTVAEGQYRSYRAEHFYKGSYFNTVDDGD